MGSCILCNSGAVINRQDSASRTIYNCQTCGVFVVSDLAEKEVLKNLSEVTSFLMSRKVAGENDITLISFDKANLDKDYLQMTVEQIVDLFPKSFTKQMDMTLKNLEHLSEFAGDEIKVADLNMAPLFYIRKMSFEALSFIIKSMQKADLIEVNYYSGTFFPCGVVISPKGWDRLYELKRARTYEKSVYIYYPKGDKALGEQFQKGACKAARDYDLCIRDNLAASAGAKINLKLIADVKSSNIVICDLTDSSPEAYYTSALAVGLEKVCVLTCHESGKNKLNVEPNSLGVIFWKTQEELYLELLSAVKAKTNQV